MYSRKKSLAVEENDDEFGEQAEDNGHEKAGKDEKKETHAERMRRFRRAPRDDGKQRAQDGVMPEFESVYDAGGGGENTRSRVAEEESGCEHPKALRENEEKGQRGEGESQFEEGKNVGEGNQLEVGKRGVAQEVGKDGGEEMSDEEIEDEGGDIQRKKSGEELKNAVDEAEGEDKFHAFARAEGGGGNGKKSERE